MSERNGTDGESAGRGDDAARAGLGRRGVGYVVRGLERVVRRASFRPTLTIIGAAVGALVVALEVAGWTDPLERWVYDARARVCATARPATVPVVHLDIDEGSVDALDDQLPWPRWKMAAILDELRLHGPEVV